MIDSRVLLLSDVLTELISVMRGSPAGVSKKNIFLGRNVVLFRAIFSEIAAPLAGYYSGTIRWATLVLVNLGHEGGF